MTEHSTNYSQVLNKLAEKHYIDNNEIAKLQTIDFKNNEKLPIMNEILIGFGSFLATLFFCGFVGAISFMGTSQQFIFSFWSLIYIALAFGCNTLSIKAEGNSGMAFWRDTSVCFMIAGKALFLAACYNFFHKSGTSDLTIMLLGSIFITAIIYPFYNNIIDRFMSVLFILILTWVKIYYVENSYYPDFNAYIETHRFSTSIMVNTYFFFHLALLGYLSYKPKISSIYEPIKYALIFSLIFYFFIPKIGPFFFYHPTDFFKYFLCTLMGITACGVVMELNERKSTCLGQPLIVILLLILFLAAILSPEIMFALILILYGYGYRENKILILGLLFLPWFLFNYYYYMPVSLLVKSMYLMIAGGVLIILGLYYQYELKRDKQYVGK